MQKILLLLAVTNLVYADFAQVKFVKGNVTALKKGAMQAVQVSNKDKFPEDTSIVTGDKSIAKLQLADGSTVSLGPKSKLVLEKLDSSNKTNVIGVLKGVLRAEVRKEETRDPKMFVKTRSAVMGVRGTTFKTVYNPAQNNTSLVTIEGEVAMAKVEEVKPSEVVKENTRLEKAGEAAVEVKPTTAAEMTKVLEENSVSVTKGQFAGVVADLEKPTIPVKVAPEQLVALVKNDELAVKKVDKTEKEIIDEVYTKDEMTRDQADKHIDAKTGELAPRSGGLIDFKTGMYVPPGANSKFDEKNNVFVAEDKIGKVDDHGDYIPPKGIIIDEKKGFMVDTKELAKVASKDDLTRLQNQVGFLNDEVKEQVASDDGAVQKSTTKQSFWKGLFKVENHVLAASVIPRSDVISSKNKSLNSEIEVYSETSREINVQWNMELKNGSFFEIRLQNRDLDLKEPDNMSLFKDFNSLMGLSFNFNYQYSPKLYFTFTLASEDQAYLYPETSTQLRLFSETVSRLSVGAKYRFKEYKKWQVWGHASLESYREFHEKNVDISPGSGFRMGSVVQYDWSKKTKLEGLVFLSRFNQTLGEIYEQTSTALGFGGNLVWDI